MQQELVDIWRRIIIGEGKGWVLFEHGTCVIFTEPSGDLGEQAIAIMREWGPVAGGSSAGDFSVIGFDDEPGWVVTSHHPDVLTFVPPEDMAEEPSELVIGLLGRAQRGMDAEELTIVHIERP
jgi:hypothetical protein